MLSCIGTIDSAAEYLLGSKITGAMVDDALTDSSDEEPPPLVAEPALLPNPNSGLFNLPAADDDELEEKVRLLVECFSVDVSDARTALLRTDRNMDNAANLLMAQSPSIGLTNLESLD